MLPGLPQGRGACQGGGRQCVGQRLQFGRIVGRDAFPQDRECVGATLECPGMQDGRLRQFQQAGAQREQVAGKVAAIHGRNVERGQRLQRDGVVPVVEVTQIAL
ncbi:hypothetical protein D3C87_1120900 [compost metagenome]